MYYSQILAIVVREKDAFQRSREQIHIPPSLSLGKWHIIVIVCISPPRVLLPDLDSRASQ
jgi:hypothetical protein